MRRPPLPAEYFLPTFSIRHATCTTPYIVPTTCTEYYGVGLSPNSTDHTMAPLPDGWCCGAVCYWSECLNACRHGARSTEYGMWSTEYSVWTADSVLRAPDARLSPLTPLTPRILLWGCTRVMTDHGPPPATNGRGTFCVRIESVEWCSARFDMSSSRYEAPVRSTASRKPHPSVQTNARRILPPHGTRIRTKADYIRYRAPSPADTWRSRYYYSSLVLYGVLRTSTNIDAPDELSGSDSTSTP